MQDSTKNKFAEILAAQMAKVPVKKEVTNDVTHNVNIKDLPTPTKTEVVNDIIVNTYESTPEEPPLSIDDILNNIMLDEEEELTRDELLTIESPRELTEIEILKQQIEEYEILLRKKKQQLEELESNTCKPCVFSLPTFKTKQTQIQKAKIEIVAYSDKSFAVIGEGTKQIKNQLLKIGGKFNRWLKCGEGWIFSNKYLNEVQMLLA